MLINYLQDFIFLSLQNFHVVINHASVNNPMYLLIKCCKVFFLLKSLERDGWWRRDDERWWGSQRERERGGDGGVRRGGRERWRTSRSLCSIRIKHPPVREKFGVFTPQTRCCAQTSQIRRKCAEDAQNAREVNFSSPFRSDPAAHPCCKVIRRSAFVPRPAAVGISCFGGTFLQLSRSRETERKSLTWTEEEEEEEEEKSSSGESTRPCARGSIPNWSVLIDPCSPKRDPSNLTAEIFLRLLITNIPQLL